MTKLELLAGLRDLGVTGLTMAHSKPELEEAYRTARADDLVSVASTGSGAGDQPKKAPPGGGYS
jgi:hypothetical protein